MIRMMSVYTVRGITSTRMHDQIKNKKIKNVSDKLPACVQLAELKARRRRRRRRHDDGSDVPFFAVGREIILQLFTYLIIQYDKRTIILYVNGHYL